MFCKDPFGSGRRTAQFPRQAQPVKEQAHFPSSPQSVPSDFPSDCATSGIGSPPGFQARASFPTARSRALGVFSLSATLARSRPRPARGPAQGPGLRFLTLGGTRPRPRPRDPNRSGHFHFPSAFFSSVSAADPESGE